MRLLEITRKKKSTTPFDPIESAREMLEYYKEKSISIRPNGTKQLFVPRKVQRYKTKKEISDYILRDRAEWAYDDEGNLLPQFQQMIDNATESIIREGVPILGGESPLPGHNKPLNTFWTSTAYQKTNEKWSSKWNDFIVGGCHTSSAMKEQGKIGYLYDVKPNTTVWEMDTTQDAKIAYNLFADLGRENTAYRDPEEWEKIKNGLYSNETSLIIKDFPWHHLAKHFDCIHHSGFRESNFSGSWSSFTYGYDVESTAWFKTDRLLRC